MPTIACLPDKTQLTIGEGETILQASLRAGLPHAHACGGRARCSTCRVWVLEGLEHCSERTELEQAIAGPLRFGPELRLACQTRVSGNLKLRRLVLDETDLEITSQLAQPHAGRSGETRTIAVLFCDIREFTSLSQRLSPYDLMFVLNRYFFHMADAIEKNGGHIEKFIGDAIMAIFGIDDTPDVPLRAIKAATDMLGAADRMKSYMKTMYDMDFEIGIGVHYGEAVIGTVSGGREVKLAAIGETVNVASRIESANKEAGTRLLISEALHQEVDGQVEVADFLRVRLRGTSERMSLYEVIRLTPEAEARLHARESRETMRFAGREWTRLARPDEIGDGQRRVFEFDAFDLVVLRRGERYYACNNSCPHMRLPFFEKRDPVKTGVIKTSAGVEIPRDSRLTEDLGLLCRWHQSCFDVQTGEPRTWATTLQADGTSKGLEHVGDVSKNRTSMKPWPCLVKDGVLWVAFD
ncbi:MAG TPA: adenylate/guanylate cyclase domain-containing protein [Methylomirabilota bacterium]|jgi:class 3 adenylate cyclase/nitrite reductase/ring-hydroxylating ferredoxin subunit|nr:adenylate/guanylate cyclase domain-containing protein [Methylomirabilota bacterium]